MSEHQTNSLLGYPDDARLLIINADDFGMCHAINDAIMQGLTAGVVTSTTLMAPCPWAPQAMQMLRDHPELSVGVHLTLVCDYSTYRWGPLASRNEVPSLIDEAGYFHGGDRIPELLAAVEVDEVEVEFRTQIDAVLAAKLQPTHLDWHSLADGGREDIFELTLGLAREYGLALRIHDPSHAERCRREDLSVSDHGVLDSYRLETEGKSARYTRLMRELPAGLSEWAVHPSLGNAEARALEPESWQVRRADFEFFTSPEARELLDREGITILDYRALQLHWSS